MTARNEFRLFLFAIAAAAAWLLVPVTLFAAESTSPKAVSVQSTDGLCKQYVREHHGHPGKAIDVVKVVHGDCSGKQ